MLKLDLDIDLILLFLLFVVFCVALAYSFLDVNYFLRVAATIGYGKFFQRELKPLDTGVLSSICTSHDLDLFLNNMGNSRYVREADIGRFHFIERSGLYKEITKAKAHILQGACNVRFRKPIPFLSAYKLTTKIIYWDEKSIYFEQQFITVKDNFIRAIMISQNKLLNVSAEEVMGKLLDKEASYRIEAPEELKQWLQSIETSSNRLRKKD